MAVDFGRLWAVGDSSADSQDFKNKASDIFDKNLKNDFFPWHHFSRSEG